MEPRVGFEPTPAASRRRARENRRAQTAHAPIANQAHRRIPRRDQRLIQAPLEGYSSHLRSRRGTGRGVGAERGGNWTYPTTSSTACSNDEQPRRLPRCLTNPNDNPIIHLTRRRANPRDDDSRQLCRYSMCICVRVVCETVHIAVLLHH